MFSFLATGLRLAASYGRYILVGSLIAGLASSTLNSLIKPHIDILIVMLLFAACLRVGPRQMIGAVKDIQAGLVFTVLLQVVIPLIIVAISEATGIRNELTFALVLFTAASALSGSPHLVTLLGFDPAPALRQVVISTALLPLTTMVVFMFLPQLGGASAIIQASLKLLAIISVSAIAAFFIRAKFLTSPSNRQLELIDGASTILMAIVVVGLMAAIQKEVQINPQNVLVTLLVACLANFGFQIIAAFALSKTQSSQYVVPIGVIAGNRNVALFLTALPPTTIEPLLLFIACYQIPMYLTPIIMKRFYRQF